MSESEGTGRELQPHKARAFQWQLWNRVVHLWAPGSLAFLYALLSPWLQGDMEEATITIILSDVAACQGPPLPPASIWGSHHSIPQRQQSLGCSEHSGAGSPSRLRRARLLWPLISFTWVWLKEKPAGIVEEFCFY